VWVDSGPARTIPNPQGGITGRDAAPNRRGAELAGLVPGEGGLDAEDLLVGESAKACSLLLVADSDFGRAAHDPKVIERLREATFLVVMGWADTPLAQAADLVFPVAHHAERDGSFTNCENRVQKFAKAFPSPGEARPMLEVIRELLARYEPQWGQASAATVFALLAATVPAFAGLDFAKLPADGAPLAIPARPTAGPPPTAESPRP
jgi:predicted molibdopterin-dependent oxidoreductase YjgC